MKQAQFVFFFIFNSLVNMHKHSMHHSSRRCESDCCLKGKRLQVALKKTCNNYRSKKLYSARRSRILLHVAADWLQPLHAIQLQREESLCVPVNGVILTTNAITAVTHCTSTIACYIICILNRWKLQLWVCINFTTDQKNKMVGFGAKRAWICVCVSPSGAFA